jgi:hypothetical protein
VAQLERTLTLTASRVLVVISIDSLDVARLAVLSLAERLRNRGVAVSLVNETHETLPDTADDEPREEGSDVTLVLAVLDPAVGAQHLREWGSNAIAIVTAGRSTETKLAANATMMQSASLDLLGVVLIRSDPTDTTLGIVPHLPPASMRPAAGEELRHSTIESS